MNVHVHEKKNSLLFMNVFVRLRRQNKQKKKKFRLSVCLSACLYVDFCCGHNNFRRSQRNQTKFGVCLLCMKCRSDIEIQSKIMILILILILNRILIFTKTLRNDTKFGGYLQNKKHNFSNDFDIEILILILKKKSEKMLWNKTEFHEHH